MKRLTLFLSSERPLWREIVVFAVLVMLSLDHVQAGIESNTHGFFSQGYLNSSNYNFFGQSTDNGTLGFREIGLNSSVKPVPRVQMSAQILYREAGGTDPGSVDLDFAVIDYRVVSSNKHNAGIRVGRVKNPIGLYNETRDVAFTRPGIVLPQSIYFDRVRDFALSADGAQLYGFLSTRYVDINIQLEAAMSRISTDTEISLFSANLPGELRSLPSYVFRLSLDMFSRGVTFAYSEVVLDMDYLATPAEGAPDGHILFHPRIFSAQLNFERFVLTAEYASRKFLFSNLASYVPQSEFIGESYYLQGNYLLDDTIRIFIRMDHAFLNKDDKDGTEFSALVPRPAHSRYARDYTFGALWQFRPAWLLMVEHHLIDGTAWIPVQDNKNNSSQDSKWWMFGAMISYRF